MGLFGTIYHRLRAGYGMHTDNYDLVDDSLEKGKRSLYLSFIDPVGIADVPDVVSTVAEDIAS